MEGQAHSWWLVEGAPGLFWIVTSMNLGGHSYYSFQGQAPEYRTWIQKSYTELFTREEAMAAISELGI